MYLVDIGREIIIILLLIYLIIKTKIRELNLIYSVLLLVHLYKTFINFHKLWGVTRKNKKLSIVLFLVLLFSFYLFTKGNRIPFLILFVLARVIITRVVNYEIIPIKINNIYNLFLVFFLILLYFSYKQYEYKEIFLMDAINHLLLFINV